jgi:hypothetical protein
MAEKMLQSSVLKAGRSSYVNVDETTCDVSWSNGSWQADCIYLLSRVRILTY